MTALLQEPNLDGVKRQLRATLLARRSALGAANINRLSRVICRHLAQWLDARNVKTVFLYMPIRDEIDARYLVEHLPHLSYALPVTSSAGMDFHPWSPTTSMRPGIYGIPEPIPTGTPLYPDESTVVLVPTLAVSHDGVRLGYGGGFFDRYLASHPASTVALLAEQFLLPSLPRGSHDVLLDSVATESGVTQLKR